MSLICSKIQGRSCRLASAFILPASACLSLSNSITSLLRFWSKAFPPSLFQVYFQRGDLEQSDLAETAFEGLVRPIMSFFHVPGPRPKKRPGTMLVRHSCQFIHFYLPVPQGVCFVVREERFLFYRASGGSFMAPEGYHGVREMPRASRRTP